MRGTWALSGALICALTACGDDDDDQHDSAGKGGQGASGAGSHAGAGGAGKAGADAAVDDASTSQSDASVIDGGPVADGGELDPNMQRVTIKFKAKVGSQDFACGATFNGQGTESSQVTPTDFRMFVQEVQLLDDQDHLVPVTFDVRAPWQAANVALLDFENAQNQAEGTGCALEGTPAVNTEITGTVPKGTYKGISFVNGVPEALNHEDPTTFGAPLNAAGMYWDWLAGFRFIKLELRTVGAAPSETPPGGVLHIGSTGCFNAESDAGVDDPQAKPAQACKHPNRNRVVLMNYVVGESVIVADASKVFAASDLTESAYCAASNGDVCTPLFTAVGLKYADGSPLTTQSFYTLEQAESE